MKTNKIKAKILLIDIETAPLNVYVFALRDQNIGIEQIKEPGYILSYSAKWFGEKEIIFDSIYNHKEHFKNNPKSDLLIAKSAWNLMNEADIIMGHNGDSFDIKWFNSRFLKYNMKPVSPFKAIDTLKVARANFKLPSYKLEYIASFLGIGSKIKHEGISLWIKCMEGDPIAWIKMERYNRHDVRLLEGIYKKMRPYMKNHPNLALYHNEEVPTCPNCGGSKFQKRGFAYTTVSKYHRYVCADCGKWVRGRKNLLSEEKSSNTFNNCL